MQENTSKRYIKFKKKNSKPIGLLFLHNNIRRELNA